MCAYHIYFDKSMHDTFRLFCCENNPLLSLHTMLGEPSLWKVLSIGSISLTSLKQCEESKIDMKTNWLR